MDFQSWGELKTELRGFNVYSAKFNVLYILKKIIRNDVFTVAVAI